MKRIITIFFLCMLLNTKLVFANEVSVKTTIYENSNIEDIANENEEILASMPTYSFDALIDSTAAGENIFKPQTILERIISFLFVELKSNIYVVISVIVLAIIFGLVSNVQSAYSESTVSQTVFFAFYTAFLGIIINGLNECITLASSVISKQVVFMKAAVPVYAALMNSTGSVTTAAGMESIFLFFIQLIASLLEKFALPLTFWIAILNMVNCITDKFSIKKLIEFAKQTIKWTLGLLMTFFIGILGLSGFATSAVDGLGVKTLKFAVGNFIPVVGGMLTDSIGTVMTSTVILKNAIGTTGVITVILMCAMPLIKILALIVLYKLSAGLIEPLCDKRMTLMMSEAGNCLTYVFLILLAVTIMFVLGTAIMLSIGNRITMV